MYVHIDAIYYVLIAVLAVAAGAVPVAQYLYQQTHHLRRQNAALSRQIPIRRRPRSSKRRSPSKPA